jgi:threonine dehydratase
MAKNPHTDVDAILTVDAIREAADAVAGVVVRTPCQLSRTLSEISGAECYLKFENQQFTGSFKDRGALIKLQKLDETTRRRGVIAMSAGNHAQGVAYHARRLAIPATIVMPQATPNVKIQQTQMLGARVIMHGDGLDEAAQFAQDLGVREELLFVHPYDDPDIMAGQGTVALEMLEDVPDLEELIIPIGGGGLISGCAVAGKALNPDIRVSGVESDLYPSMYQLMHNEPIHCDGQSIAEGIAVKAPGKLTAQIARSLVDEFLLVGEEAIESAIDMLVQIEKTVVEGAGAAALAALLGHPDRFSGRKVGLVITGGNIDTRLLSSILMRGLIREGRIVRLRVEINDRPGALAAVATIVGECNGNILEVHHQRMYPDVPAKLAELDVVLETPDRAHVGKIASRLRESGYDVRELTEGAN